MLPKLFAQRCKNIDTDSQRILRKTRLYQTTSDIHIRMIKKEIHDTQTILGDPKKIHV